MSIEKSLCARLIKDFDFRRLFNELGWDYVKSSLPVEAGGAVFELEAAAEKREFAIFVCQPPAGASFPDYGLRKTIDNAVARRHFEHLIIYVDSPKSRQVWQLVIREHGKPTRIREEAYYQGQEPELLFQKLRGIFFSIEDEEKISLVDVKAAVHEQFEANAEKVTKKFYDVFKKEHTSFLGFIEGIDETVDREWYASLMLNRLMFIYFIQKKGFLDNNVNYLREKLKATQAKKGRNKFYSFYRNFLLVLFHKGLGSPERTPELEHELGRVPYLNGGLFDVHELEEKYGERNIPDKAFERIFEFFDQYNWHLDTRITASGKDINPDVIGYIFEKYINDRAAMGAYYTKEDITEYISKNCIIPYLFDEVKRKYPKAFDRESFVWTMLRASGDRYIYDAVKFGIPEMTGNESLLAGGGDTQHSTHSTSAAGGSACGGQHLSLFSDLPEEIAIGLDTEKPDLLARRKHWNRPAPPEAALPTEIWREVIERRKRYRDVRENIENGEITEINDFITYNLNIRQFAQDVVETIDDPDFIRHFYAALSSVTILDPTCGSGAFLFAALNILEPLYEACILRMENYVNECTVPERRGVPPRRDCAHDGRGPVAKKFKKFEEVLFLLNSPQHPNRQYFIHKSIILNNLYGVDIMNEAVEIAKLRLFLKLVATVDVDYRKSNLGLEPLPDIDFNIRAGNTLVGFVSLDNVKNSIIGKFGFYDKELKAVEENAEYVQIAYESFKQASLENDNTVKIFKANLNEKLMLLNEQLNIFQARIYGIYADRQEEKYNEWCELHKPFHWFAEFYNIIQDKGGFDVIIGNPPYVEDAKRKDGYAVRNYETLACGNLYAYIIEKNTSIIRKNCWSSMIIPHSAICTDRMSSLMKLLKKDNMIWLSTYSIRPAKLFDGVDQRLGIYIIKNKRQTAIWTGNYNNWYSESRPTLFSGIKYCINNHAFENSIAKIGNACEIGFLSKMQSNKILAKHLAGNNVLYYHNSPRYWIRAMDFVPYFWSEREGEQISSHLKALYSESEGFKKIIVAILNSSLFYWWFILLSNCRDFSSREIVNFPAGLESISPHIRKKLSQCAENLMKDFVRHAARKECYYNTTGKVIYDEFYPKYSKAIIDDIDKALAEHYGFTEEELDYIINYDIKYRMGKDGTINE